MKNYYLLPIIPAISLHVGIIIMNVAGELSHDAFWIASAIIVLSYTIFIEFGNYD